MNYRVRGLSMEERVSGLLVEWYWERRNDGRLGLRPGKPSTLFTNNVQSATHHDWKNGAEDERAEKQRIAAICLAAESVPMPWQYALQVNACYLATRRLLWPPTVTRDPHEREVLLLEARNKFAAEAIRRKIIDTD